MEQEKELNKMIDNINNEEGTQINTENKLNINPLTIKYPPEYFEKMKRCGIHEKYIYTDPMKIDCNFKSRKGDKSFDESREVLLKICKNPSLIASKSPVFFFYGKDGTGKQSAGTHILRSLRETINRDTKVEYRVYSSALETFYSLKNESIKSYNQTLSDTRKRDILERIETSDAIMLHGLNYSNASKGFGIDPKQLIGLIRERRNKQKFTIITSLFSIEACEKHSAFFSDIKNIVTSFCFPVDKRDDEEDF